MFVCTNLFRFAPFFGGRIPLYMFEDGLVGIAR